MLNLKCRGNADPNGPLGRSSLRQNFQLGEMEKLVTHLETLFNPVSLSLDPPSLVMDISPCTSCPRLVGCLHGHYLLVVNPQAVNEFIASHEEEDKRLLTMGNHALRMLTLVQSPFRRLGQQYGGPASVGTVYYTAY